MPTDVTAWRPLLTGTDAEAAVAAVSAIARDLAQHPAAGPSLAHGAAGRALFEAYRAAVLGDHAAGQQADAALDQAIAQLADETLPPGLYAGYAGVAWVTEHLQRFPARASDGDANAEIDAALAVVLRGPWTRSYDLIEGLVGIGVYGLERAPRASGLALVQAAVEQLARWRWRTGGVWLTPPQLLVPTTREYFPAGRVDLGVAHGVPAAIALISAWCAWAPDDARAQRLRDEALAWLVAQRLDDGPSTYAACIAPDAPRPAARCAWCYGDPGIAAALHAAGTASGAEALTAHAFAVAQRVVRRPASDSGVVDAGLCHGAIGVAHLLNRLAQRSGDAGLASAAAAWYRDALARRQDAGGAAGFTAATGAADPAQAASMQRSLLTGTVGIGLALLAAISPVEPAWDRLLLASLPPLRAAA